MRPQATIILRGHVHYTIDCGDPTWRAIILPALQGMGSKYGARQCSGTVDFGITVFDVEDDGSFVWKVETVRVEEQAVKVLEL
jgi:hypothetical protein